MAVDPFTAAFGNFAGGLGKGLGDAIGGGGGPFIGGSSQAMSYGATLDAGGWIVNVGGTQDARADLARTTTNTPSLGASPEGLPVFGGGAPVQAGLSSIAGLFLVGVAAVMLLRQVRKG